MHKKEETNGVWTNPIYHALHIYTQLLFFKQTTFDFWSGHAIYVVNSNSD